jgi:hypothetical protein
MKLNWWAGGGLLVGLGLAIVGPMLVSRAHGRAAAAEPGPSRKVELTIYSEDFALVREIRGVKLAQGANRLAFADVSRELDPNSVLLQWEDEGKGNLPEIIGHSYDLGATDSQGLLKNEIGKAVEIVRYGTEGREVSRERGRLLVAEGGRPAVVEVGGKLYVNPEGTLVLDREDGTPTIPQLSVQAESSAAQAAKMAVAYLTRGLRWNADYVATLPGAQDDRMDLKCQATVTNRTGVRYPEAAVTLVAGSPSRAVMAANQRVQDFETRTRYAAKAEGGLPAAAPARAGRAYNGVAAPESVAEFHAYPLKNPATVQSEQLTSLLMMSRDGLRVKKDYSYRAPQLDPYSSPQDEHGTVTVGLSFANNDREGLGAPLPQGAIRVYDPDRSGRLRYAGAAEIQSTPLNGKVHFTLSNAFDVTAEYRTVSSKRVGKRKVRKAVEVLLRNERAKPVRVRVVQGFYNGWTIPASSQAHVKLNSSTAQWTVPVPPGKPVKLAYTAELSG